MPNKCIASSIFLWLVLPGSLYGEVLCSFTGKLDLPQKKIDSTFIKNKNSISVQYIKTAKNNFLFKGRIENIPTPLFRVSLVLEGSLELIEEKDASGRFLRGTLISRDSLINHKPVPEISGYFEIKNGRVYLHSLSWAGFVAHGYMGILAPFEIGLDVRWVDVALEDLAAVLGCKEKNSSLLGMVSGQIIFSGFLDRLVLKGKLTADDGVIQDLKFDNILVNFDGLYPLVHIGDSHITEANGLSFNMEGNLDLRDRCHLMAAVTTLEMSPLIDETDVHREWTIKRKQESDRSATEFKYRLQKQEKEDVSSKEEADMFSIEHSIKF